MVKSVGSDNRYLACVRFNGKRRGNEYAGVREIGAVFVAGRFDRFVETAREQCAGAAYAPFPELENSRDSGWRRVDRRAQRRRRRRKAGMNRSVEARPNQ